MPRKKKGELPSGNIRRRIYDHSEPIYNENGQPVIDPKTGKQKKKRIYKSVTASNAKDADLLKAQIKSGKTRSSAPHNMTLREAIEKYISSSDAILSPSTIKGYKAVQQYAFSQIMDIKLSSITNDLLRDAVNLECKRTSTRGNIPLSPKTVRNEYGLLSAVLNMYAPGLDCTVKLPQVEHNKNEISTPDKIYEIVKGTDIELPVLLAMWLSLTISEIKGLTKSESISSDGNYLKVKNVIVLDSDNNYVVKTKGKQPTRDRTLRLPGYIKGLIEAVNTDQIVTMSGNAIYKKFQRLINAAGLPHMTFHDLRHVNASVMAMLNVPDKYAQERGGWSTDAIMKSVYQQTFSPERAAVDARIDDYFNKTLLGGKKEEIHRKKYDAYLLLFDLSDSPESRESFKLFCECNPIKY